MRPYRQPLIETGSDRGAGPFVDRVELLHRDGKSAFYRIHILGKWPEVIVDDGDAGSGVLSLSLITEGERRGTKGDLVTFFEDFVKDGYLVDKWKRCVNVAFLLDGEVK